MNAIPTLCILFFYGLSASLVDLAISKGAKPFTVVLVSTLGSALILSTIWLSGFAKEWQEPLGAIPKTTWVILLLLGPLLMFGDFSYAIALATGTPKIYVFAAIAAVAVAIMFFSSIFRGSWPHPMQFLGLAIICVGGFLIRYYAEDH